MLKLTLTSFAIGFGAYAGVRLAQVLYGELRITTEPAPDGLRFSLATPGPCQCAACREASRADTVAQYEALAHAPPAAPAPDPAPVVAQVKL